LDRRQILIGCGTLMVPGAGATWATASSDSSFMTASEVAVDGGLAQL
jgi:hypothetical protein